MKLLLTFILSIGLFAQTGIPYYKNGVLTYVNPIGGIIVDVPRKQIRTAINGGLRGTPNQLWSVNANGDGEAIDVDWNLFAIAPPGTNGRRMLTLVPKPQNLLILYNNPISITSGFNNPTVTTVLLNNTNREATFTLDVLTPSYTVYLNEKFLDKKLYTLKISSKDVTIKISDDINILKYDRVSLVVF